MMVQTSPTVNEHLKSSFETLALAVGKPFCYGLNGRLTAPMSDQNEHLRDRSHKIKNSLLSFVQREDEAKTGLEAHQTKSRIDQI